MTPARTPVVTRTTRVGTVLGALIGLTALTTGCGSDLFDRADRTPGPGRPASVVRLDPTPPRALPRQVATATVPCDSSDELRGANGDERFCRLLPAGDQVFLLAYTDDGTVTKSTLRAYDAGTLRSQWQIQLDSAERIGVAGRRLLAETGSGLVSIDPRSGRTDWTAIGVALGRNIDVADGVIAREPNGTVLLDPDNGTVRWRVPGEVVARCGNRAVVVEKSGSSTQPSALAVRSFRTAKLLWRADQDRVDVWSGHQTCVGDTVLNTDEDSLTAFDAADGTVRWRAAVPGGADFLPGSPKGLIVAVERRPRVNHPVPARDPVYGIDLRGRVRWRSDENQVGLDVPGTGGLRSNETGIWRLDTRTGRRGRALVDTPGTVIGHGHGRVAQLRADGLACYRTTGGAPLWRVPLGAADERFVESGRVVSRDGERLQVLA